MRKNPTLPWLLGTCRDWAVVTSFGMPSGRSGRGPAPANKGRHLRPATVLYRIKGIHCQLIVSSPLQIQVLKVAYDLPWLANKQLSICMCESSYSLPQVPIDPSERHESGPLTPHAQSVCTFQGQDQHCGALPPAASRHHYILVLVNYITLYSKDLWPGSWPCSVPS